MIGYSQIRDAIREQAPKWFAIPGYAEMFHDAIGELESSTASLIHLFHQQDRRGEEIDVTAHAWLKIRRWMNLGKLRGVCLPVERWAAPDADVRTNQNTLNGLGMPSRVVGGDHGTDGYVEVQGLPWPLEIGYQPMAKTFIQLHQQGCLVRLPYDPENGMRPHIAFLRHDIEDCTELNTGCDRHQALPPERMSPRLDRLEKSSSCVPSGPASAPWCRMPSAQRNPAISAAHQLDFSQLFAS